MVKNIKGCIDIRNKDEGCTSLVLFLIVIIHQGESRLIQFKGQALNQIGRGLDNPYHSRMSASALP